MLKQAESQRQNGSKKGHPAFRSMLAQHVVDFEKKRVIVTFGKKLTVEDIQRYAELLLANPSFRPDFAEIVDIRQVEQLDLQANDFLKLADHVDPFSPTAKRAFVVRDSVQSHAARMHKILRTQRNIEIFRSLEAAELWLEQ